MKKTYQIPNTENTALRLNSIILVSPPAPLPNGGEGNGIGGD